jgi:hypothetical protein
MKGLLTSLSIAVILSLFAISKNRESANPELVNVSKTANNFELLQEGDIIFQSSQSKQCEAVKIATQSKFSHCGIIYIIKNKKYVYEAVQPVKITPLKEWVKYGEKQNYLVKRVKNASTVLNNKVLEKMKTYGKKFKNKDYDGYFEWSDDKIYCSELVWKIYKNGANIELCKLKKLKDFNLKNQTVQSILRERYGNNIPYEEAVVAPSQIADSPLLETIIDTY